MSKSWVVGDWAAEAERAEEEEKARAAEAAAASPPEAFPLLSEAVAVKPRKKKTFTIAEFTIGKSVSHGSRPVAISDSRGLTTKEMMMLPMGPRDRSSEEALHGGMGGAFADYRGGGDHRGVPIRFNRERDRGSSYGRGYERDQEASGFLHDREQDEPSRADESHDWSSLKKAVVPQGRGYDADRKGSRDSERREPHDVERRGFRQADAELRSSRADEVENWGLVKTSLPLVVDARLSKRNDDARLQFPADEADNWASSKKALPLPVVIERVHAHSRADEAANWSLSKRVPAEGRYLQPRETNADVSSNWGRPMQQEPQILERTRVVLAPRSHHGSLSPPPGQMNADVSNALPPLGPKPKSNPFGSARPREEVLANRGPEVLTKVENEPGPIEHDSSRLFSGHASRPSTPEVSVEPVVKPKAKANPFGNAKPREVLLQERGKDWRKIDFELEHRGVDRPETKEEMDLKEEIRILTELSKQEVAAHAQSLNGDLSETGTGPEAKLHSIFEQLCIKEKELQGLIVVLDDNVRFSQKVERPRSLSGRRRSSEFSERSASRPGSRPGSRSGWSDKGSNYDPLERLGSLAGRKNLDASDRIHSLSGYGGGRGGERPWSRSGLVEGASYQEAAGRTGPWSGHNSENRSFEPVQRPRLRSGRVPTEVGGGVEYSQQVCGPDIWIRGREDTHCERQMSWREQERVDGRAGVRMF